MEYGGDYYYFKMTIKRDAFSYVTSHHGILAWSSQIFQIRHLRPSKLVKAGRFGGRSSLAFLVITIYPPTIFLTGLSRPNEVMTQRREFWHRGRWIPNCIASS